MREAVSGRIDQLEAEVKQVKLQTKVRILSCGERDVMATCFGVTFLSSVGCLKEELVAATDGSWEEEKKDLEQQLQARQGPQTKKHMVDNVLSFSHPACDSFDKNQPH